MLFLIVYFYYCNSFGVTPARALQVLNPLPPGMSHETSLPLNTTGAIQRMEPLTNLQVSKKYLNEFCYEF